jgi:hypothetical protein
MALKPIIGKDYWPSPTLRQMPSGWVLEESRKPAKLPAREGVWAALIAALLIGVVVVQVVK